MPDESKTAAPMWLITAAVTVWPCMALVLLSGLLMIIWPGRAVVYLMEFFSALMMVMMTIATIGDCWMRIRDVTNDEH